MGLTAPFDKREIIRGAAAYPPGPDDLGHHHPHPDPGALLLGGGGESEGTVRKKQRKQLTTMLRES
ncbi:MAG: hypothetical protein D3908_04730 [Candidatus Electrothrix sp. AUS4]|nr:hypothetical protein [Candidatus Electrothrix sp. AUS4]